MELRCSRDLALWLGAIGPENTEHHRHLRNLRSMILIRDGAGLALFWPLTADAATIESS